MGEQLDLTQRQVMLELVGRNRDVFSEEPGHTELAQRPIIMESGKKVKHRPYHIPEGTSSEAQFSEAVGLVVWGNSGASLEMLREKERWRVIEGASCRDDSHLNLLC
ncbi:hypothetical protein AAFF_G00417090 [Aldrovandia affinis]|uniref:Uncharacterized protein n=1 Tax=Aldrovandia affinis TaxID=143900 RepID=A0AAD7WJB8_9TELE|nr:hypothetical protein AAFF_G00417090 [Aldrovandia affinis]